MSDIKKVTGAIAGKSNITLFFSDGASEVLTQENYRTNHILEAVLPALSAKTAANDFSGVDLDLGQFKIADKVAALTGGAVKVEETLAGDVKLKVADKVVDGKVLIPHMERAALDGSKSFANFMKKFGEIRRQHTCDELLNFMGKADLPFAEDGAIIGYKILDKTAEEGVFVDPHTKKVKQRLGSLVYMPDSKVDDNRRVLCSTGLHIASRAYLRSFWYTDRVLTLVRIQPKDVIAVPINESSKMRVSAYHIVKVLSDADAQKVVSGTADIHDLPEALKLLEEAASGVHTPIIERVKVGARGEHEIEKVEVKQDRIERRKVKKTVKKISKTEKTEISAKALKVEPKDIRILNKMIKEKPHLAGLEPKYLKGLIKAQRLLEDGESLRNIAKKLKMDRDALARNLIRKAA